MSLVVALTVVGLVGCTAEGTDLNELKALNLSSQQGIWVTGEGKVSATPDIVELRLGIEAQETSVVEAQTEATAAMDQVMAALIASGVDENDIQTQYFRIASGVDENDIQTQYFSIRRVTRWDRDTEQEVIVGYRVTHMVTAKIRDVDEAGTIIDAVAEAGGDLVRVDSINFSIDDPSDYYNEARVEAMADAKDKAERLAELGGVTLGKPTYISEGFQAAAAAYEKIAVIEYEEAVGAPTPISPGEMEISLIVQVAYAILD